MLFNIVSYYGGPSSNRCHSLWDLWQKKRH